MNRNNTHLSHGLATDTVPDPETAAPPVKPASPESIWNQLSKWGYPKVNVYITWDQVQSDFGTTLLKSSLSD